MLPYIASSFSLHPSNPTVSFLSRLLHSPFFIMTSEPQKLRVTEIKVRMDCNGCVQKIKKALHGIIGISELYIDFSKQKVIIVGWADPENIVKAIKKTRKSAVICSHTEQSEQSAEPSTEVPPEGSSPEGEPPHPDINQAGESEQTEGVSSPEPQAPDNQPPESEQEPSPDSTGSARSQLNRPPPPKELEEIHVVYHYPPDYGHRLPNSQNAQQGYSGPWHPHSGDPRFRADPPQPVFTSHNYNTYKASPYLTGYKAPQPAPLSQSYNTYRPSPYMTESQSPQPATPRHSTYRPTAYMAESQGTPLSHGYNTYRPTVYMTEPQPPQPVSMSQYTTYNESPLVTESQPVQPVHVSHSYNAYRPPMFVTESQPVQPVTVSHSYNTYKPSPYVTEYAHPRPPPDHFSQYGIPNNAVPEAQGYNDNAYKPPPLANGYAYQQSPLNSYSRYGSSSPLSYYSHYTRPDSFSQEYYNGNHGNGSVTSIFSEENPNACTIV